MGAKRSGKILLVEDYDGLRSTYKRYLEDAEHFVFDYDDGADALKDIRNGLSVDIALIDLEIPGFMGGGNELSRLIKKEDSGICIIGISAYKSRIDCASRTISKLEYSAKDMVKIIGEVMANRS
jgi:DNA-binding NtrC family response regulator